MVMTDTPIIFTYNIDIFFGVKILLWIFFTVLIAFVQSVICFIIFKLFDSYLIKSKKTVFKIRLFGLSLLLLSLIMPINTNAPIFNLTRLVVFAICFPILFTIAYKNLPRHIFTGFKNYIYKITSGNRCLSINYEQTDINENK